MLTHTCSRSVVRAPGASAELVIDDPRLVQMTVHNESGLNAARATAGLVRQAVLDASTHGVETLQLSLDVSTPACGIVLTALHGLAAEGFASPQLRRAGGTLLVDMPLTPRGAALRPDATRELVNPR